MSYFTLRLLVLLSVLKTFLGIPTVTCEKDGRFIPVCDRIFIYSEEQRDFVSLSNVTMRKPVEEPSKTLNVMVYNMHPFIIYDHNLGQLSGYLGDIWNIIQETGQLKINITVVRSFSEGEKLIELGKADIYLGAGVALENQSNTCYTQPFLVNWYHLYLKTPKVKGSTHSYLKTFSVNLWFATCGLFMILSLTVFLTIKLLNRWHKVEPSVSLPSCFLGVVSGFINQEFNLKLISISGRIQILFSLLLGVVLLSSMNAVLFSRLAVLDLKFPFRHLSDISKSKTLSICVRNESFVYEDFKDNNSRFLRNEWNGIVNNKNCLDIVDQSNIDKIICRDNVIVFENRVIMSSVQKRTKFLCDVVKYPEKFYSRGNIFSMTKSLKKRFLIKNIMTRLRSAGIFHRLENKWVKSFTSEINTQSWNVVNIEHVGGILYFYFFMILLSLAILGMEILWFEYSTRKDNTLNKVNFQWME